MVEAIRKVDKIIVLAKVSRTVIPVMVEADQVFDQKIVVFVSDETALLALLSSAPHYWWASSQSATMKADISYSQTDVFHTLAVPHFSNEMRRLGATLGDTSRHVRLARQLGLTKIYNLVFDSSCKDRDIAELREIHRQIDEATFRAYGWDDMIERGLDHGFHVAGKYMRYTIGPGAQQEMLDRLLELNRKRYDEEVALGLHDKSIGKKRPRGESATVESLGAALFDL